MAAKNNISSVPRRLRSTLVPVLYNTSARLAAIDNLLNIKPVPLGVFSKFRKKKRR